MLIFEVGSLEVDRMVRKSLILLNVNIMNFFTSVCVFHCWSAIVTCKLSALTTYRTGH